jgi:hypothetical protein
VTQYGPPGDPNEDPTGRFGFNERGGDPSEDPTGLFDVGQQHHEPQAAPTPWYRKRLTLLVIAVVALALIVIGLVALLSGGHGKAPSKTIPPPTTTSSLKLPHNSPRLQPRRLPRWLRHLR